MTWRGSPRRDDGAATVWTLALLALVLIAGLVSSAVAIQAVARQRASTAADIAALAAAQSEGNACAAAERAAAENGAMLAACAVDAVDVQVTVSYPTPEFVQRVLSLIGAPAENVTASARAGPARQ